MVDPQTKAKAPDWLYTNIAEAAKNARKIYLLYLAILSYSALTVITTTDRQLILNQAARLPVVNIDIPLIWFFLATPIIIVLTFVYLQIYLQHLQRLVTTLHHDYKADNNLRLYPWMVLVAENPLQRAFVSFTLWFYQPMVLILFAVWILKKHELMFSYSGGILPLVGTLIVIVFSAQLRVSMEGRILKLVPIRKVLSLSLDFLKRFRNLEFLKRNFVNLILFVGIAGFEIWVFSWALPLAQNGDAFVVDLSFQKLVEDPAMDYPNFYWLDMRDVHLEGAKLDSTVLKRTDFRGANLTKASLRNSNLQASDFEGAILLDADLGTANLSGANLGGGDFNGANFGLANLSGADLRDANLTNADFSGADLSGADFNSANLSGANLFGADFSGTDLKGAVLIGAVLKGADFYSANLTAADLFGANLMYANLSSANLSHADLLEAIVSASQLEVVKSLYYAKLPDELEVHLRQSHPELFESPTD